MATSFVAIANKALGMLGNRARVASLDPPDGSVEAGLCATFLPDARRLAIEQGTFPFTYTRVQLAQLSSNASGIWQFAYQMPDNVVMPLRIIRRNSVNKAALFMQPDLWQMSELGSEQDGAQFEWQDNMIFTNESQAVMIYKRDVIDPRYYTPGFEHTIAMSLAGLIAGPIIGGREGINAGAAWSERAATFAKQASANAANASKVTIDHVPSWMAAR